MGAGGSEAGVGRKVNTFEVRRFSIWSAALFRRFCFFFWLFPFFLFRLIPLSKLIPNSVLVKGRNKSGGRAPHSKIEKQKRRNGAALSFLECGVIPPLCFLFLFCKSAELQTLRAKKAASYRRTPKKKKQSGGRAPHSKRIKRRLSLLPPDT
ncbi:MAG: hypothetical protein L0Y72_23065 [Gemmataceae bacterium]|nr:hypothetical protein [Gemmataceae bacterium]MCI0741925.1 hypothetical protein [Gemmataceae bacterium]